ncbi:Uncharacterised protein [Vibrio cholerae]|nr:Uncharacterised protein [Vibrio cholerae]
MLIFRRGQSDLKRQLTMSINKAHRIPKLNALWRSFNGRARMLQLLEQFEQQQRRLIGQKAAT